MAILNKLFEKADTEDVTKSLGNVLISGTMNVGQRSLSMNLLMDLLRQKKTLLLVHDSKEVDSEMLKKFVAPHMIGRSAYEVNINGTGDPFDILSAYDTPAQKTDCIMTLLAIASGIADSHKDIARRFYQTAMKVLDMKGVRYKIKDLAVLDIEAVEELVSSSPLSEFEKHRAERFLADKSTYAAFLDLDTGMSLLESSGFLELLSGDLKVKDMLRKGNVILLSGQPGKSMDTIRRKELLLPFLFYTLSRHLEEYKDNQAAFYLKDADVIPGPILEYTLQLNDSYWFASYVFIKDICSYIVKNGNAIMDSIKTFLVFTQGSDANAEFWSNHFGSREVWEKSFSYTKKKSLNPFDAILNGGGVVASPRKNSSVTTTIQKVDKPIYKANVFKELKPDEVMVYLRSPLTRRKKKIGG